MGSGITDSIFPELSSKNKSRKFTDVFEELCPYFMSIGVSYDDFWNGEFEITKFALKADEYTQRRKNSEFWLNSIYIFRAILDAAPAYKEFSNQNETISYSVKEPFPLSKKEIEKQAEKEKEEKMNRIKDYMISFAKQNNEKYKHVERSN